jgi:hypothetical protein
MNLRVDHPLVQHGGIIFLGQILLVMLVPLVDRGEIHTPVELFAAATAVSAVGLAFLAAVSFTGFLLVGETIQIRLPGTVLLMVAYLWGSSLSVRHAFSAELRASQRILCGAAGFVMLGFMFAALHTVLGNNVPGAYVMQTDVVDQVQPRWIDYIWLSFSTLTTAGYGQLAPVGRWANAVCTLEALCGILFPATLIARIASLPAMPSGQESSSEDGGR